MIRPRSSNEDITGCDGSCREKCSCLDSAGITTWSAPWSEVTPSIVIVLVPPPPMRAPMAFKSNAKSTISGSCAALSIMVTPSANVAANQEIFRGADGRKFQVVCTRRVACLASAST